VSEPGPLSAEQKGQLAAASAARAKLLRPARIARFNAWTVGVFGALSVVLGLATGGSGALIGIALIAIAWNEARGAGRLSALDPEGARILGWNQLVLAGVVAVSCAAAIAKARTSPDPAMKELEELGGISAGLVSGLTTVFYAAVGVIVALVQALLARYHFRARERVAAFRRDTPDWVLELLGTLRR
jgi:hypothetical protein